MHYVAVTLKIMPCNIEIDIDLPWRIPLPDFLTSAAGLKQIVWSKMPECFQNPLFTNNRNKIQWRIEKETNNHTVTIYTHTLRGAGVYDGDTLIVRPYKTTSDPYRYYLELVSDMEESERIYLVDDEIVIGRHVPGDNGPTVHVDMEPFLQTVARFISRRHLRITRSNNGFYIQDLGSQNGTSVNGTPLHSERNRPSPPYRLNVGDEITLSRRVTFKFYDKENKQRA